MVGRSYCSRKEFDSLVGVLSYAAATTPSARTFMRRLYSAQRRRGRFVRLNRGLKCDLQWWLRYWSEYNGVSLILEELWRDAEELQFWTDASLDGYGACFNTPDGPQFFGGLWSDFGVDTSEMHISELEMLAVGMAVHQWGQYLAQRRVLIRVDNEACVHTLASGRCRDPGMMVCMREMFFTMAKDSFLLRAKHIGTKDNVLADAASRSEMDRFYAFGLSEFGWRKEDMTEVTPSLDVAALLRKMRSAAAAWTDPDGGDGVGGSA
jgi:hypothetical protein